MAYALARVARAEGVGMMELARSGDLADVLYAHFWIEELERLDTIARESDALHQAVRMNWAFNAPKELKRERSDFRARLWRDPGVGTAMNDAEKMRVAHLIASIVGTPAVMS